MRPIGVDLFAGAGGMSLGFEQAGYDVVAAVEIDPVHSATHAFNFPNCAVICRSVEHVTGAEIRAAAGIGEAKVDVVFGGAPCQGFSLIGQRVLDDPRNALAKHFVRLVDELKPRFCVFENVKGLTLGAHRQVLDELVAALKAIGYNVRMPWRVLNAADHGVPQNRQRLFLMAARRGEKLPEYPAPVLDRVNAKDALDDLPDAEKFPALMATDSVRTKLGTPSAYVRALRGEENAPGDYSYRREWDRGVMTGAMRADHTEESRRRFAAAPFGKTEPGSRLFKLDPAKVCNTLRAGTNQDRGAFTSPRPIHYRFPRCVTVRELQRLHGYPDWFRMHVTKWHGARQVGNSVPPPLARAVASTLIEAAGIMPEVPEKVLRLGRDDLLSMTLKEASAFWGVSSNVIAKRTRRTEADVEIPAIAAE